MPDTLVFDLTLIEIPVKIGDVPYTLREATSEVACKYHGMVLSYATEKDGKTKFSSGLADVEPSFVAMCMFDAHGKPVPESVVRAWPSRVVSSLYDRAKEISGLNAKKDETTREQRGN